MAERRPNKPKVVGSIPTPRIFHEKLGPAACPYLERWVADFGLFSLRLHRWLHSDDMRAYHDHAWWFLSLCLRGCLVDVSVEGEDVVTPGSVRFRRAEHRHAVRVVRPAWTLLLTGSEQRLSSAAQEIVNAAKMRMQRTLRQAVAELLKDRVDALVAKLMEPKEKSS